MHLPKLVPLPEINVLPFFLRCKTLTHPARPSSKGPSCRKTQLSARGLLLWSPQPLWEKPPSVRAILFMCLATATWEQWKNTGTGSNPSLVHGAQHNSQPSTCRDSAPRQLHTGRLRCWSVARGPPHSFRAALFLCAHPIDLMVLGNLAQFLGKDIDS